MIQQIIVMFGDTHFILALCQVLSWRLFNGVMVFRAISLGGSLGRQLV